MKLKTISILLFALIISGNVFAQNAEKIIKDIITNIEKTVISADFLLKVTAAGGDTYDMSGKFVLKNEKFTVDMPEMKIWFDGKTMWNYSPQVNEVTITEPDKTEIASVNPLLFIKNVNQSCTKKIKETQSSKNQTIILVSKTTNVDFEKIELTVEKTTNNPVTIMIYGKNKSIIEFNIKNQKIEKNIDNSVFTFNKNNYKGVYVNDLR